MSTAGFQNDPRATFAQPSGVKPRATAIQYLAIARIDHWFKNIFMIPGLAAALVLSQTSMSIDLFVKAILAFFSASFIASANYTINEWLDADTDRHHPTKHERPAVAYQMSGQLVWLQWSCLIAIGLLIGSFCGKLYIYLIIFFAVMGFFYNVKPIRTKDRAYLDVLSESVNNPIRLIFGWLIIVPSTLPPSSFVIAYWMGGAFLMASKRYGEYRFIGNPDQSEKYRRSFKFYTEEKLILSCFFYAISCAFFLGIFLIKYRIEFLLLFPAISLLFVWYLHIAQKPNSIVQRPEKLYTQWQFGLFVLFIGALSVFLFFVDIPFLHQLLDEIEVGA